MKAAVLNSYNRLDFTEVEMPHMANDEVLVKVKYASICGSDQHIYQGEFHPRTSLPLIPGHEFAGEISRIGKEVKNFFPGQKVTVDPIIWCGVCPACQRGHYPACTSLKLFGIDLDGGFAEYISVPEKMLYHLPEVVPDKHAALIEVLSIGFHAINRAGLKADETVLIWGAGKVGQCILQAARTRTRNTIILVDILDERLQRAGNAYPDVYLVNAAKTDAMKAIQDIMNGKGVDAAFEAVGHAREIPGTFNPVRSCVNAIRGAGRITVLGLSDHPAELVMKELIWKEGTIITSRVSHGEFAETIDALEKGMLQPEALISGILPLSDADKGFRMLEEDPANNLKILLEI